MENMNVITFTKTGHILGVVARATQPDKAATVEQVAAGGFRVRNSTGDNVAMTIREDEISVVLVNYDTRVLYRPYLFTLDNGSPEQKTLSIPPNIEIELDGLNITATVPDNYTEPTEVLCQISGGSLAEPFIRSVKIPPDPNDPPTNTATEELHLGAGNYNVAMFAPGYALAVFTQTVP